MCAARLVFLACLGLAVVEAASENQLDDMEQECSSSMSMLQKDIKMHGAVVVPPPGSDHSEAAPMKTPEQETSMVGSDKAETASMKKPEEKKSSAAAGGLKTAVGHQKAPGEDQWLAIWDAPKTHAGQKEILRGLSHGLMGASWGPPGVLLARMQDVTSKAAGGVAGALKTPNALLETVRVAIVDDGETGTSFTSIIWSIASTVALVSIAAYLYKANQLPLNKAPKDLEGGYEAEPQFAFGFAFGLFDFTEAVGSDMAICLCSFCCLPIRWSETVSHDRIKIASFWTALIGATVLLAADAYTYGFTYLLFVGGAVYARQQLRDKYKLEQSQTTMIQDVAAWFCCPCCTAVQEARQVDYLAPDYKVPKY